MKKLILAIAISAFVTFGALGIQQIIASSNSVELARIDKKPKKNSDKKNEDSKTKESAVNNENSAEKKSMDNRSNCSGCTYHCCSHDGDCHPEGSPEKK